MEEEERCKASSASASGIEEPLGQQELPNELMDPALVNVLLATLDQKQSQWTAMHCCASPTGLNLMFHFRSDQFHRSWRDFQGTTKHAVGGLSTKCCPTEDEEEDEEDEDGDGDDSGRKKRRTSHR